jgi:hypothetical protein
MPPKPSEYVANDALKDIYFAFDKADIRPGEVKTLDANGKWLKVHDNRLVLIEGHCDERGTAEYNLALGERRARTTMNYLISRGIPASRITIVSYGKERPVCNRAHPGMLGQEPSGPLPGEGPLGEHPVQMRWTDDPAATVGRTSRPISPSSRPMRDDPPSEAWPPF